MRIRTHSARPILLATTAALAGALIGYLTNISILTSALLAAALALGATGWLAATRLRDLAEAADRLRKHADPSAELDGAADEIARVHGVIRHFADALRQRQDAQQVTEARFANIVDIVADAIISVDDDQRIVLFNHGAEQIFGFQADEVMGQPLDLLMPVRFTQAHRGHVREFGAGSTVARQMGERRTIVGRRKDGTEFPAEASIARGNEHGRTVYTTILRDITERHHAETGLRQITEGLSAVTGSAFFRSLVQHLARTLEVEYALVGVFAQNRLDRIRTLAFFADGRFVDGVEYDLPGTPCERVARGKFFACAHGVRNEFPHDALLADMGVDSYMGSSLVDASGRAIGLMAVLGRKPLRNSSFGEALFRIFAVRAAAEIERQHMVDQLSGALQEIENLIETMPDVLCMLDADGRLIRWNRQAERATGRTNPELDRTPLSHLMAPEERDAAIEAIRRALTEPISEVETHVQRTDGASIPYHWRFAGLKGGDGRVTGLVGIGRDITESHYAEETIRQLAYYDPLTLLPNRVLVHQRLEQALRSAERGRTPVAFLLMDLNDFKDVNNTLGHHHGDLVLKEIGPRLQGFLRQSDTVARLGGDEFALLLPDTDQEGALRVAQKAHEVLAVPFKVEGLNIAVEASIGIAHFPDHGATASVIMQRADVAMYAAKRSGSGSAVYAAERDHYSARRLALMGELRYAIEHNELALFYQPKIHMQTRRVIGVEALLRWRHPHRGIIPPDEFIPLAERSGLIRPLTAWVLSTALDQARAWEHDGLRLSVAVNLSARNLSDAQLPDHLTDLLRRTGALAGRLELEITESSIMADPARALDVLTRLHRMGIPLAIDDFGTGYSSLGYLKRLPVSAVKVDKSFVKNMETDDNDAVIVRSTVELAHNLGLQVIAEGVETSYLWDRLAALGCDAAQGYYMSQPMPADALSKWFVDSPWQVPMVPPASAADAA